MPTRIIYGTAGADLIYILNGHDATLNYDNIVYGSGGADIIYSGSGNDWIWGQFGDNSNTYFYGGTGDDVLVALGTGNHWLQAGTGNDVIIGAAGNNTLIGGQGNDQLWGGSGNNTIIAGAGNNLLVGGKGGGTNFLYAAGQYGNDILIAGDGNDSLIGGYGNDQLWGGSGNDQLNGGFGKDVIVAGSGKTAINGGLHDFSADYLVAGSGVDIFVTSGDSNQDGYGQVDVVWGFKLGTDKIQPDQKDLSPGSGGYTLGTTYYTAFPSAFGPISGTLLWSNSPGFGDLVEHGVIFLAGANITYAQLQPSII